MLRCKCCGYECDCMDLYYDHIMFDRRHQEMAQRESAETSNGGAPQARRSRHDLRGKRSSLLYSRRQHYASPLLRASPATTTTPPPPDSASAAQSADSSPLVAPKQALVFGSAGY
ncbi:hypothetical protein GGI11_007136 [Coemansia sp. RSA 2049]|nr:hypothetical protein GGI11_007136 [Coemansia sp. RSA 2049]KAJ2662578.1 hypothetical protein GGH99_006902 [Coemansia sp. RSA 1285]